MLGTENVLKKFWKSKTRILLHVATFLLRKKKSETSEEIRKVTWIHPMVWIFKGESDVFDNISGSTGMMGVGKRGSRIFFVYETRLYCRIWNTNFCADSSYKVWLSNLLLKHVSIPYAYARYSRCLSMYEISNRKMLFLS